MKTFISSLLFVIMVIPVSVYSFVINGADSSTINFDNFRNKKILLVNIATGSDKVDQLDELQELHQQFGDSLVIIGFPSNSFGNESRNDSDIVQFCHTQYGVNFFLAAKAPVTGSGIQPLYEWLSHESKNGISDTEVKGDFQKYLIDCNGELLGIFAGSVSPLSSELVSVIVSN